MPCVKREGMKKAGGNTPGEKSDHAHHRDQKR
jgi:hypothetical protein